jgi:type VI protein secretion system component VasK
VDVVPVRRKTGKDVMGWIAACVLVALLLPLWGMVYLDNLTTTNRAEKALEKLEKLEQRLERKERDKNRKDPDAFGDNPVFDRVRRPLSVSLPRPEKLGKP